MNLNFNPANISYERETDKYWVAAKWMFSCPFFLFLSEHPFCILRFSKCFAFWLINSTWNLWRKLGLSYQTAFFWQWHFTFITVFLSFFSCPCRFLPFHYCIHASIVYRNCIEFKTLNMLYISNLLLSYYIFAFVLIFWSFSHYVYWYLTMYWFKQ